MMSPVLCSISGRNFVFVKNRLLSTSFWSSTLESFHWKSVVQTCHSRLHSRSWGKLALPNFPLKLQTSGQRLAMLVMAAACDGALWPKCILKTRSIGGQRHKHWPILKIFWRYCCFSILFFLFVLFSFLSFWFFSKDSAFIQVLEWQKWWKNSISMSLGSSATHWSPEPLTPEVTLRSVDMLEIFAPLALQQALKKLIQHGYGESAHLWCHFTLFASFCNKTSLPIQTVHGLCRYRTRMGLNFQLRGTQVSCVARRRQSPRLVFSVTSACEVRRSSFQSTCCLWLLPPRPISLGSAVQLVLVPEKFVGCDMTQRLLPNTAFVQKADHCSFLVFWNIMFFMCFSHSFHDCFPFLVEAADFRGSCHSVEAPPHPTGASLTSSARIPESPSGDQLNLQISFQVSF